MRLVMCPQVALWINCFANDWPGWGKSVGSQFSLRSSGIMCGTMYQKDSMLFVYFCRLVSDAFLIAGIRSFKCFLTNYFVINILIILIFFSPTSWMSVFHCSGFEKIASTQSWFWNRFCFDTSRFWKSRFIIDAKLVLEKQVLHRRKTSL